MSKQTIDEAVQNGVREGIKTAGAKKAAERTRESEERNNMAAARAAASDVLEGLTVLQELPGSKFSFSTSSQIDRLFIHTNVPTRASDSAHNEPSKLYIIVEGNGTISAYGDARQVHYSEANPSLSFESPEALIVNSSTPGAAEEVLSFVAKLAADKGLVTCDDPKIGKKMLDGTVYVGGSPNAKPMYTTPEDAGVVDIMHAEKCIRKLNDQNAYGHNDWRLPDASEKETLLRAKDTGALSRTFNGQSELGRSLSNCYLSSEDLTQETVLLERAEDGFRKRVRKKSGVDFVIRPVRN